MKEKTNGHLFIEICGVHNYVFFGFKLFIRF